MTLSGKAPKHASFVKSGKRISLPFALLARNISCTRQIAETLLCCDWSDLAEDRRILRAGHRRQVSRTSAHGFNGQQSKGGGLLRKWVDAIEGNRCRHGWPEGSREIFHERAV